MRTPANTECPYYYEDFYRGRSTQECRLVGRNPWGDRAAAAHSDGGEHRRFPLLPAVRVVPHVVGQVYGLDSRCLVLDVDPIQPGLVPVGNGRDLFRVDHITATCLQDEVDRVPRCCRSRDVVGVGDGVGVATIGRV